MSPTARTLKRLKEDGYAADVVERWAGGKRHDLFGLGDVLAIGNVHTLLIQTTTGSNHAARRKRALAEPLLERWKAPYRVFEIWSWSLRGERGKRKTWQLRRERL